MTKSGLSILVSILTEQVHKYNPLDAARSTRTMAWMKKSEGLDLNLTAKGRHVGSGWRVANFFVAIAYNQGIILC